MNIITKKTFLLVLLFSSFFCLNFSFSQNIYLGIDVLKERNFSDLKGKRVGLLTHRAGVDRYGKSTVEILNQARKKGVNLTALFGPEHGIYGNEKADVPVEDKIDPKTGLPVFSLYGKFRRPSSYMLSKIDVLVIDLQDIGCRSYTYVSCMLYAMEECFKYNKQVIILDRPNPLGGLKVDGPFMDRNLISYVGSFTAPYVHGLTIGEIALLAKSQNGYIYEKYRKSGKLKVIPMRGWTRNMTWDKTGLKWIATSPAIPNLAAVIGYPMTGLGCQLGGFKHGYGSNYPFRSLSFNGKTASQIIAELNSRNISGLAFKPNPNLKNSVYIFITDYNKLNFTELSLHLMAISCKWNNGKNPFSSATNSNQLLFNKHTGSQKWFDELAKYGSFSLPFHPSKNRFSTYLHSLFNFSSSCSSAWLFLI